MYTPPLVFLPIYNNVRAYLIYNTLSPFLSFIYFLSLYSMVSIENNVILTSSQETHHHPYILEGKKKSCSP